MMVNLPRSPSGIEDIRVHIKKREKKGHFMVKKLNVNKITLNVQLPKKLGRKKYACF